MQRTIGKITNEFHPTYNINQLKALKKTTSLVKTVSPLKKFTTAAEYASVRKEQIMGIDNVVYDMCKSYFDDAEIMRTETFNDYCFRYLLENTSGSSCSCSGVTSPLSTAECTNKSLPASGGADFVKYYEVYRHQTTEESTAGRSSMRRIAMCTRALGFILKASALVHMAMHRIRYSPANVSSVVCGGTFVILLGTS